jgi:SAM-dependent methyltransferase
LPPTIEWVRCASCGHVHNRACWTEAGLTEVRRNEKIELFALSSATLETRRSAWAPVVDRVVSLLGGYRAVVKRQNRPTWVDVGCADGALIMTAADCGMAVAGLETRGAAAECIRSMGLNALQHDFLSLKFEVAPDVLSMMDVLEQMPHPGEALLKAAQVLNPGGVLVISTADMMSSSWRALEADKTNPYWKDLERYHIFTRERLITLVSDSGFEIVDFRLPQRSAAQMEIYALRKPKSSAIPSR